MKYLIYKGLLPILIICFPFYAAFSAQLTPEQALGKQLFYDARLSQPAGQACGQCHAPTHGFSDPRGITAPVSEGVHKGRFTSRNAPTVAYLATAPDFHFDKKEGLYIGGFFLDGRSQKLEQQVLGPLLSPVEMANQNRRALAQRLRDAGYEKKLEKLYGENALADTDKALASLGKALAAWIRGPELNAFTSKYDYYLAGKVQLTEQEKRGLKLFEDEKKGNCAACHPSQPEAGKPPVFTDFSYDNLGVPANSKNPFYTQDRKYNPAGRRFVDTGLGKTVNDRTRNGKFKVPTLRNVGVSAPYMHNGVFATLKEVVEFYNTRDTDKKWATPEVSENVNTEELGDLKLTNREVDDLAAFMKTLTDGYNTRQQSQQVR